MDPHRLADERSLAYHRVIAERLSANPEVLARARSRARGWLRAEGRVPPYARLWAEILARDSTAVAQFLVERSELANELRQSSPFAGVLRPDERWRIWRRTREQLQCDERSSSTSSALPPASRRTTRSP